MRLLKIIKQKYPHLSQKQIKNLLSDGLVLVNGQKAKVTTHFEDEDVLEIPPQFLQSVLEAQAGISCKMMFEHDDYYFLHKDVNIHSVAQSFWDKGTVANWLLSVDETLRDVSDPLESGLVNRLDYETSGLMVAARSKDAFLHLKQLLKKEEVQKEYFCLVSGHPPVPGVYQAFAFVKGKAAKQIRVLETPLKGQRPLPLKTEILDVEQKGDVWLVKVRLHTGVRHQIRAHLAYLGSPIVGDDLYGDVKADRLMLHSHQFSFTSEKGDALSPVSPSPF